MKIRQLVSVFCLLTATLVGVPGSQQSFAEEPSSTKVIPGRWYIVVTITRHGQRSSRTFGGYDSREGALGVYQRFVQGLEPGANPKLERVYFQ